MQRDVVLIFGQTGSGKTTKARELLATTSRALVVESGFGEFQARAFEEFDPLVEYLDSVHAYSDYAAGAVSYVPFRVAYTPRLHEQPLMFDLSRELGNLHLFLEEADRFDDPRDSPEYDEIITRGRHYGISVVAVGLHFFKLPKELRRQATSVYSFKQIDAGDIEALAEVVGPVAYRLGPDESGRFSIPDFSYLHWTPAAGARIVGPNGAPIPDASTQDRVRRTSETQEAQSPPEAEVPDEPVGL